MKFIFYGNNSNLCHFPDKTERKGLLKKQTLLVMKLVVLLLTITSLQLSAKSYAQQATLRVNNASLGEVLEQIYEQTGYQFVATKAMLKQAHLVSISVENASVKEVLNICFKNQPLTYLFKDKVIIIKEKTPLESKETEAAVPPPVHIQGTVSDSTTGRPLVGVTIQVRGTTIGTTTGNKGNFSLDVPDNAVLLISYLGYSKKEIHINGRTEINIELLASSTALDQLVVVGYGTQKRKDLTGSVSVISSKAFKDRPNTEFGYMIEGKAAGVQVIRSSGMPQAGFSIRIRGTSSITSSSEPLYIVDGIPTQNINEISPGDIKSISILKDAASAAIYGASGANGVVLITTKGGGDHKAKLSLNVYDGYSTAWKHLNILNSSQYKDLMIEEGQSLEWSQFTANTNWQNELFRTGNSQNYQLSLSGGNKGTDYYMSGTLTKDDGIVIANTVNRANFRLNFDHQINDAIKVGAGISYDRWRDVDVSQSSPNGSIMNALLGSPIIGIWSSKGEIYTTDPFRQDVDNPVALAVQPQHNWINYRFHGNIFADITLLPYLKFKSQFGFSHNNGVYNSFTNPTLTVDGRGFNGRAERSSSDNQYWISNNTLNFTKSFNQNSITALVGFIASKTVSSSSDINTHNFANPAITTVNGGSILDGATGTISAISTASLISRVTYNYNEKYLAMANFRADASSVFGPENRWGYFPSFAIAWRLSKENFMENIRAINDLKIRASWGQVGNASIGAYSYLGTVAPSGAYVIGGNVVSGYTPQSLNNFRLKWETTQQTDVGIDLAILDSRIALTADYYYKKTFGLLLNAPVPSSSGFTSALKNIGNIQNKGLEFGLTTHNLVGKFQWNSEFNISFNRNKVLNIAGGTLFDGPIQERGNSSIVRAGLPLGSFYGYIAKGVDPKTGNMIYQMSDTVDGLSTGDERVIGNANPKFIFGFTNDFTYNRWSLTVFFQGVQGNDILNVTRIFTEGMWQPRNQLATVLNRWEKPGQVTNIPREDVTNNTTTQPNYNSLISSRFIENGSYVRLKSINLSYEFSQDLIKKIKLSSLSLYVTAENLLTFTKYSGFDPEVSAFSASSDGSETNNIAPGVDYGTYPQARTVIFGLNVSF